MSKKDKLLSKLRRNPKPKDFAWDDLVTLMKQHDFTADCQGGSHYTFEHSSGFRFCISKTHPAGILKSYQIDATKVALDAIEKAQEGNDERNN